MSNTFWQNQDAKKRYEVMRGTAEKITDKMDLTLAEIDRALVGQGLIEPGQTVDPTKSCMWTVTGRDGMGKLFKTCTIHGEHKVVPE